MDEGKYIGWKELNGLGREYYQEVQRGFGTGVENRSERQIEIANTIILETRRFIYDMILLTLNHTYKMKSGDQVSFLSLKNYRDRIGSEIRYENDKRVEYEKYLAIDDLVGEASIRIIEKLGNYRPEFAISTFIAINIVSEIHREARKQCSLVYIPTHTLDSSMKYLSARHKNGRPFNLSEIVKAISEDMQRGESGEKLESARFVYLAMNGKYLSLDEPSPQYSRDNSPSDEKLESQIEDVESLSPEEQVIDILLKEDIKKVLSSLTPREEEVLQKRFFKEENLEDTAQDFYVTRERIRQIEAKALRKMRHPARTKSLRSYYREENFE